MSSCRARIDSYFSRPTDLATAMVNWPEFVAGSGYDVDLESESESVTVRLVPAKDDDTQHVLVEGKEGGRLFLLALGYVTYAMSENSDEVWVMRWMGG
jgi:hypothetical protein